MSSLLPLVLAVAAALCYGTSDFIGGLASRRARVLDVSTIVYGVGACVVLVVVLATAPQWSAAGILIGVGSGFSATIGFVAFYAALASGPIALLSPLIAVIQAIVPVGFGLFLERERLDPAGWAGIGAALVGSWLMAGGRSSKSLSPRSLALAVTAGLGFGVSIVILNEANAEDGLVPALFELAVGFIVILLARLGRRAPALRSLSRILDGPGPLAGALTRPVGLVSAAGGCLMGAANALVLLALHAGNLAVVGALLSLYPLATIALAAALLGERLMPRQWAGAALAVAACAAFSL